MKFIFKPPLEKEPLTFSSAWSSAGGAGNLAIAVTFTPYPMNITWLDVQAVSYKYTGLPSKQVH
ncbi:MAG: hypothetical protein GY951_11645 [Psychromonas sp.]|nr:hypothetical protein [Psychromonas sp.]